MRNRSVKPFRERCLLSRRRRTPDGRGTAARALRFPDRGAQHSNGTWSVANTSESEQTTAFFVRKAGSSLDRSVLPSIL